MTAPVIRQYPGTIPDKGQAQTAFDTNVDAFLDWQALQFAPDLVAFGTWADQVRAALIAGNLPPLTGRQFDAVRVNAAGNGVEFADVTSFGWALMADTSFSDMRTRLGLGTAAIQTVNNAATLAIANLQHLARAGQVVTYVASEIDALLPIQDADLDTGAATAAGVTWWGLRSAAVAAGAVGTYVLARRNGDAAFGSTVAGSSLTPTSAAYGVSTLGTSGSNSFAVGSALAGTWRCMGTFDETTQSGPQLSGATLFLRIS